MSVEVKKSSLDGFHDHGESNPDGLHTHESLGILEMGGGHDHGVDFWGSHVHRGQDGRMLVHVGGIHWHDYGETETSHYHSVLGAIDRAGLPMDIEVSKSDGMMIVKSRQHSIIDDEEKAIDVMKSEGQFEPKSEWAVLYQHKDIPGCYLTSLEKKEYKDEKEKKEQAREIAKSFSTVFGEAELVRVRGGNSSSLMVERVEKFSLNGEKLILSKTLKETDEVQEETQSTEVDKGCQEEKTQEETKYKVQKTMEVIHSLNVMKTHYKNLDEAKVWVQKNGFNSEGGIEFGDSFYFLQDNGEGPIEEKVLAPGIVVSVQKTQVVEKDIPFSKIDKEKRMVEGIVYEPYVQDSEGDWMTPVDIEKMAHDFIKNSRHYNIDTEHDQRAVDGLVVVESFIAPPGHPLYPEGSWIAKTFVGDDDYWAAVLDGTFNGYSMGGSATRLRNTPIPSSREQSSFYKSDKATNIAKSFFLDPEEEEHTPGARLTNVKVQFLSFVNKGANGRDFQIRKSAKGKDAMIFKSRGLSLLQGENPVETETTLSRLFSKIKDLFSSSEILEKTNQGTAVVPEPRKVETMAHTMEQNLLTMMAYIAKRSAAVEDALVAISKSKSFGAAVQQSPEFQETLAKLAKERESIDLQKFFMGVADYMEQQGNNGVNFPSPQDFSGHVQQIFGSPERFLSGFSNSVHYTGSFSGQAGEAISKKQKIQEILKAQGIDLDGVEIRDVPDATQPSTDNELAKRLGEMTVEQLLQADDDVLARGMEVLSKRKAKKEKEDEDEDKMEKSTVEKLLATVEKLQAKVTVLEKSDSPKPSQDAESVSSANVEDHNGFAIFGSDEDDEESIRKSLEAGTLTPESPFGCVSDMNGIRGVGAGSQIGNTAMFSTNRQRGK